MYLGTDMVFFILIILSLYFSFVSDKGKKHQVQEMEYSSPFDLNIFIQVKFADIRRDRRILDDQWFLIRTGVNDKTYIDYV